MMTISDGLYIGNAVDEEVTNIDNLGLKAILNVACDLYPTRGWKHGINYLHIGLMDGPGNLTETYCAAILALRGLLKAKKSVMVCSHDTGRSLAVVMMYLALIEYRPWYDILSIIRERFEEDLPEPHEAHRDAFMHINWQALKSITGAT